MAQDSPDLHEVRRQCHEDAVPYVILDGTLRPSRIGDITKTALTAWG
ncbi:hypothetical protein [Streptomyces qinglanensis]